MNIIRRVLITDVFLHIIPFMTTPVTLLILCHELSSSIHFFSEGLFAKEEN